MRYPKEAIENYRKDAGDLENEVIDEYRSGTMSRTELFKRGSVVGISLPMLGAALRHARRRRRAVSRRSSVVRDAADRAHLRRRLARAAAAAVARRARRLHARGRAARLRRQERGPAAHARDVVEVVEQREDLDVPAPQGRQVPRGAALLGGRRRRDVQDPAVEGLPGAAGLQGSPQARAQGRPLHRRVRPREPERPLPVPARADGLPGRDAPEDVPAARRTSRSPASGRAR